MWGPKTWHLLKGVKNGRAFSVVLGINLLLSQHWRKITEMEVWFKLWRGLEPETSRWIPSATATKSEAVIRERWSRRAGGSKPRLWPTSTTPTPSTCSTSPSWPSCPTRRRRTRSPEIWVINVDKRSLNEGNGSVGFETTNSKDRQESNMAEFYTEFCTLDGSGLSSVAYSLGDALGVVLLKQIENKEDHQQQRQTSK